MAEYGTSSELLRAQLAKKQKVDTQTDRYDEDVDGRYREPSNLRDYYSSQRKKLSKITGSSAYSALDIGATFLPQIANMISNIAPSISKGLMGPLGVIGRVAIKAPSTSRKTSEAQELKAYGKDLGAAGKMGKAGLAFSLANRSWLAGSALKSLALGGGQVSSLASMMGPLGMGLYGAQILGGMWSKSKIRKLQSIKKSPVQEERKNSLTINLDSQIASLTSQGQLNIADQFKIRFLGFIEQHTSMIPLLYTELEFLAQQKEKAGEQIGRETSNLMYGEGWDQGIIDRGLTSIVDTFQGFLSKYDPFTQLSNFIFGGFRTPKEVMQEIESGRAETKEEKESIRQLAISKGISVTDERLLSMDLTSSINKLPSYESKILMATMFNSHLNQVIAKEILTLRKGMGITDNAFYQKADYEKGIFGQLRDSISDAMSNIPGLNAIYNIGKDLLTLPWTLREKVSGVVGWARKALFGEKFLELQSKEAADKRLGIYRSKQEQATEFAASGLPSVLADIRAVQYSQLEQQENIFGVLSKTYRLLSAGQDEYAFIARYESEKEPLIFDAVSGAYLKQSEFEKILQSRSEQRLFLRESEFRKTLLGSVKEFIGRAGSFFGLEQEKMEDLYDKEIEAFNKYALRIAGKRENLVFGMKETEKYEKVEERLAARPSTEARGLFDIEAARMQREFSEDIYGKIKEIISTLGGGVVALSGLGGPGIAALAGAIVSELGLAKTDVERFLEVERKAIERFGEQYYGKQYEDISEIIQSRKELVSEWSPEISAEKKKEQLRFDAAILQSSKTVNILTDELKSSLDNNFVKMIDLSSSSLMVLEDLKSLLSESISKGLLFDKIFNISNYYVNEGPVLDLINKKSKTKISKKKRSRIPTGELLDIQSTGAHIVGEDDEELILTDSGRVSILGSDKLKQFLNKNKLKTPIDAIQLEEVLQMPVSYQQAGTISGRMIADIMGVSKTKKKEKKKEKKHIEEEVLQTPISYRQSEIIPGRILTDVAEVSKEILVEDKKNFIYEELHTISLKISDIFDYLKEKDKTSIILSITKWFPKIDFPKLKELFSSFNFSKIFPKIDFIKFTKLFSKIPSLFSLKGLLPISSIFKFFKDLPGKIASGVAGASFSLWESLTLKTNPIIDILKDAAERFKTNIFNFGDNINNIITTLRTEIKTGFIRFYDDIKTRTRLVYDNITSFIDKLNPITALKNFGKGISEWWVETKKSVIEFVTFKSLREKLKKFFLGRDMLREEAESKIIREDIADEKSFWKENIYWLKKIHERLNRLPRFQGGIFSKLIGLFSKKTKTESSDLINSINELLSSINSFAELITISSDRVCNSIYQLIETLSKSPNNFAYAGGYSFSDIKYDFKPEETIVSKINPLQSLRNEEPEVKAAEGVIATGTKPVHALIGEAGEPEAVVPVKGFFGQMKDIISGVLSPKTKTDKITSGGMIGQLSEIEAEKERNEDVSLQERQIELLDTIAGNTVPPDPRKQKKEEKEGIFSKIFGFLADKFGALLPVLGTIAAGLGAILGTLGVGALSLTTGGDIGTKGFLGLIGNLSEKIINKILGAFSVESLDKFGAKIGKMFSSLYDDIALRLMYLPEKLGGILAKVSETSFGKFFTSISDNVISLISGMGTKIMGMFSGIADTSIGKIFASIPEKMGAVFEKIGISKIFSIFDGLGTKLLESLGISALAKAGSKVAIGTIAKTLAKKLPFLGALFGLGFGIKRALEGDFVGALGEIGSGLASIVPGWGTAASIGIDAWLAVRDAKAEETKENMVSNPEEAFKIMNEHQKNIDKRTEILGLQAKMTPRAFALLGDDPRRFNTLMEEEQIYKPIFSGIWDITPFGREVLQLQERGADLTPEEYEKLKRVPELRERLNDLAKKVSPSVYQYMAGDPDKFDELKKSDMLEHDWWTGTWDFKKSAKDVVIDQGPSIDIQALKAEADKKEKLNHLSTILSPEAFQAIGGDPAVFDKLLENGVIKYQRWTGKLVPADDIAAQYLASLGDVKDIDIDVLNENIKNARNQQELNELRSNMEDDAFNLLKGDPTNLPQLIASGIIEKGGLFGWFGKWKVKEGVTQEEINAIDMASLDRSVRDMKRKKELDQLKEAMNEDAFKLLQNDPNNLKTLIERGMIEKSGLFGLYGKWEVTKKGEALEETMIDENKFLNIKDEADKEKRLRELQGKMSSEAFKLLNGNPFKIIELLKNGDIEYSYLTGTYVTSEEIKTPQRLVKGAAEKGGPGTGPYKPLQKASMALTARELPEFKQEEIPTFAPVKSLNEEQDIRLKQLYRHALESGASEEYASKWADYKLSKEVEESGLGINPDELKRLIESTLQAFNLYSPEATSLLMGTAAQESKMGKYKTQIGGGPAKGIFQIEPNTEKDVWTNYLAYKTELKRQIQESLDVSGPNEKELENNVPYQIIMARLVYERKNSPIPTDIEGQAAYWKQNYNTYKGKGTTSDFVSNYAQLVTPSSKGATTALAYSGPPAEGTPTTVASGELGWPTSSPVITSPYGARDITSTGGPTGPSKDHKGIDIRAKTGDPVFAAGSGIVSELIPKWGGIKIDHGNGFSTRYLHLSKIGASEGMSVEKGQLIGNAGSTGPFSMPPHLHFETQQNGVKVDPEMVYSKIGTFNPQYASDIESSRQITSKIPIIQTDETTRTDGIMGGDYSWAKNARDMYSDLNSQEFSNIPNQQQQQKFDNQSAIIPIANPQPIIIPSPNNQSSGNGSQVDSYLDNLILNLFNSSSASLEKSVTEFPFGNSSKHQLF